MPITFTADDFSETNQQQRFTVDDFSKPTTITPFTLKPFKSSEFKQPEGSTAVFQAPENVPEFNPEPVQSRREQYLQNIKQQYTTGAAQEAGVTPENIQKLSDFVKNNLPLSPSDKAYLIGATAVGKTGANFLDWLTSVAGLTQTGLAFLPPARIPMAINFFGQAASQGGQRASDAIDAWKKGDMQGVADAVSDTVASFGTAFLIGKGVTPRTSKVVKEVNAAGAPATATILGRDLKLATGAQPPNFSDIENARLTTGSIPFSGIPERDILAENKKAKVKATVPETPAEAELNESVIQEIQRRGLNTKRKIQSVFPHLNNQEAQSLWRTAWPDLVESNKPKAGQKSLTKEEQDLIQSELVEETGQESIPTVPKTEKIVSAAVKTPQGILTGPNHPSILEKAGMEIPPSDQRNTPDYGFVTDKGRFIEREEAAKLATENGQNLKAFEPNEPAHSDEIAAPGTATPISEIPQPVKNESTIISKAEQAQIKDTLSKTPTPELQRQLIQYRNAAAQALKDNKPDEVSRLALMSQWTREELKNNRGIDVEPQQPQVSNPMSSQKYKLGNNPQLHTLVEKLPQTDVEKSNNEQLVRVRNDKTGEESIVMESDLKKVKQATQPKQKKQSLDEKLKTLGYTDVGLAALSESDKKALVERMSMGAATPEEFERGPQTPTGIKNATVDKERAKRGLPPAMEPARRAFGTVWDETMAKYDQDPTKAYADEEKLVKELSERPRAVTDSENAILLHRQIDLQNEYGKATRELSQAVDDAKEFPNRQADAEEWKLQVARLSDQLLELYNINKRVGTETGRGLALRRMMANEDYSLAAMETRLRAEKGGKELTTEEKGKVAQISKKLDETKKAIDDYQKKIEKDSTSPALKSLKTRYANRIEELLARMEAGDYAPKTKTPLQLDAEALRLKAAYENAKLQFDRMAMKERLKNRTLLQKTQDTLVKWRRAFLLSSPVTLAKLTSAAIERFVITPTEELVGAGLGKIPGISQVVAKAPREGGFNVKAEAKALTDGFIKGMEDAAKTLKTGHSDLDSLYGRRDVMPREMIDFIGSIHGALKAPVKRAEFARSFQKRAEFAMRQGSDVSDPMIQTRIAAEAYKDANRSIFMQDNRVTAAWNAGIAILKAPDKETGKVPLGRRTLASAAQIVLPIVKVPTNIIAETMQYALGSVTGSVRLASAVSKGIENLKPEEADLIMRQLKKGSLGAAMMTLGYLNPSLIGGYYQANDQKRVGHPKFGTIKIGDWNVPTFLIHNPLLETLQIGATIRHVADSKLRMKDQEKQGVPQGTIAAALGLVEEVPFLNEPLQLARLFNPYERNQFADQFARDMAVPLGVSWVAQHFDKDANGNYVVRKTTNLEDTIKSAIPGLRETLPVDYKKTKLLNQP